MSGDHKQSSLISEEESSQVFTLLGVGCKSLVTTVVQLYITEPPNHDEWIKKDTGFLCFIKDRPRKNYFFRLYCLRRNTMVWQQEVYNGMKYDTSCQFLHTFEGEGCMVAFNFASTEEAKELKTVVDEKLLKNRIRQARRPAEKEIGEPSEFRHLVHIGWDQDDGFNIVGDDPQMTEFFNRMGIGVAQNHPEESFDFIRHIETSEAAPALPPRGSVRSPQGPPPPPSPPQPQPSTSTVLSQPHTDLSQDITTETTKYQPVFEERSTCVICLDEKPTNLVVPCGHKIYCRTCSEIPQIRRSKFCPVCKGKQTMVILVRE